MSKIGVFICHCGDNIAGTVDVGKLKDYLSNIDDLVITDHMFLCSEAGQEQIVRTIDSKDIDRVVIASCSPMHHEDIFQNCIKRRLNPFMWEMANIREHCSWVHSNKEEGTEKALSLIKGAIEKVRYQEPIDTAVVPIKQEVLVIGGGISGMHASLEMADKGSKVHLVERGPSIGGNMTRLGRTFPTDDCAMCTVSPIMNKVKAHPMIELLTLSEVEEMSGTPGDFKAIIRKHPRYVDPDRCTSCGLCVQKCPVTIDNEFDLGLGKTKAIHIPFESCVPNSTYIQERSCLRFQKGVCGICEKVCPAGAVDLGQKEQVIELTVGAVIVSTGYRQRDMSGTEYNMEHPNVITGLQLERMITPSGPTGGKIICPSDGRIPKNITFVQCVGSRDRRHNSYCSNICCMYTAKNSKIIRAKMPDANINVCYIDIRAPGKMYEEYYATMRENNIKMIMGIPSEIMDRPDGSLYFDVFDKATKKLLRVDSDLIIMATSIEPSSGMESILRMLHIPAGEEGFLIPRHVKIAPVDTPTEGIFTAGTSLGPKAIQECITDAGAVASRVATLLKSNTKSVYLDTAVIDPERCTECGICQRECNYNAITMDGGKFKVVDLSCRSCGKCVSICPAGAITLRSLSAKQIKGLVGGILSVAPGSVIAYSTSACGYMAADIAGTSRKEYPPDIKIIKLTCACQLTVEDLVDPFEMGANGILILSCPEALHHYVDEVKFTKETIGKAKDVLRKKGIDPDRIRLVEIVSPDGAKLQKVSTELSEAWKETAEVVP